MTQKIGDVVSTFSKKLKRFSASGKDEITLPPTRGEILQQQINEREKRLRTSVVASYKIYKSPFEALGEKSDRAASIDKDEQNLLAAYNIYKSVMDADKENKNEQTFITKIELASPLAQKASYTDGGQFIYLMMWLFFEQNCREYMPLFKETEKGWTLCFVAPENYQFENHDKEIFDMVNREFYL